MKLPSTQIVKEAAANGFSNTAGWNSITNEQFEAWLENLERSIIERILGGYIELEERQYKTASENFPRFNEDGSIIEDTRNELLCRTAAIRRVKAYKEHLLEAYDA